MYDLWGTNGVHIHTLKMQWHPFPLILLVLPIPIVVLTGGVRSKDYLIRYSYNESHPNYDKFKAWVFSYMIHTLPACTTLFCALNTFLFSHFVSFRCWLPTEYYTIFAFIGPMVAIIVVSFPTLTRLQINNTWPWTWQHIKLSFHSPSFYVQCYFTMANYTSACSNVLSRNHRMSYIVCTVHDTGNLYFFAEWPQW